MPAPPQKSASIRNESWENERGSFMEVDRAESLGIVRHLAETSSAGDKRYTNLTDAIAQARRMTRRELELDNNSLPASTSCGATGGKVC